MRENRLSGLMRGGKLRSLASKPLTPSLPAYSTHDPSQPQAIGEKEKGASGIRFVSPLAFTHRLYAFSDEKARWALGQSVDNHSLPPKVLCAPELDAILAEWPELSKMVALLARKTGATLSTNERYGDH